MISQLLPRRFRIEEQCRPHQILLRRMLLLLYRRYCAVRGVKSIILHIRNVLLGKLFNWSYILYCSCHWWEVLLATSLIWLFLPLVLRRKEKRRPHQVLLHLLRTLPLSWFIFIWVIYCTFIVNFQLILSIDLFSWISWWRCRRGLLLLPKSLQLRLIRAFWPWIALKRKLQLILRRLCLRNRLFPRARLLIRRLRWLWVIIPWFLLVTFLA